MAINNFDVLKEMCNRDLNIRMAPLDNITEMHKTRLGAKVTIGVEYSYMEAIADGKVVGGFILADREQFERVKKEMEDGEKLGKDH